MNSKAAILFLILSTCRNIACSKLGKHPSAVFDLTQTIQSSIRSLFQNVEVKNIGKFLKQMDSHNNSINFFLGNDIFLKELHAIVMGSSGRKFDCDFSNNEMQLAISHLYTKEDGSVRKNETVGYLLSTTVNFYNVSITATESSTDISYSTADTRLSDNLLQRGSVWLGSNFTEEQRDEVKKSLKSVLPKLVHKIIKSNDKFATALQTSPFLQPKKHIISDTPEFLTLEPKFYYLIRESRFPFFNFKNITIRGLTNFESFKSNDRLGDEVHTLVIKNIRGNFTLDYKSKNQTISEPLELYFKADYLDISVDLKKNRVNVQARDYRVVRSESDAPLTYDQSAIMMHHIESAMATSIIPFTKVWWNDNQPSIRYDNEDQVRQTLDGILSKKGPYDYQISFHNVTVKLISGFPHPQQIHCEFPNNLNITHRINAKPIGTLRLNNEQDSTIDINFHVNFTSINFSVIHSNSSKENDTCEFHINPNKNIKVEFSPSKNANGLTTDELKLKEKIDQTLVSMEKQGVTRHIKTVLCSPYSFCKKSAKVFDDYFLSFLKNLLKKCSLRRN